MGGALFWSLGIGCNDAAAGVGESEKVGAADVPKFDCTVLNGQVVSAGHQGFEGGELGEEGVLAIESSEARVLKILVGDYGVFEIAREIVCNLSAPSVANDERAEAGDDDGDDGHAQEKKSIGSNSLS